MSRLTKLAAAELRGLGIERERLESLKMELHEINAKLYAPRGASMSDVPSRGSGRSADDKLIDGIENPRRKMLMRAIADQQKKLKLIESALAKLSPIERRLLEACYMGEFVPVAALMAETNYAEAQLSRIKFAALSKYAYMRGLDTKL